MACWLPYGLRSQVLRSKVLRFLGMIYHPIAHPSFDELRMAFNRITFISDLSNHCHGELVEPLSW